MKTFLTSIVFLLFLSNVLFAEIGFESNRLTSKADFTNPQIVAGYLNSFMNKQNVKKLDAFAEITEKRLVSSTSETREEVDGEYGNWYVDRKTEYSFRDDGFLNEMYEYILNEETMELELMMKIELDYNENGEVTNQNISIYISDLDQFMEFMKAEIEYSSEGNILEMTMYQIDFGTMSWITFMKVTYEYTDGNLTHEYNFSISETGELFNNSYTEYFYNEYGNLETSDEYILNNESGEFVPISEINFIYDSNGKVVESKENYWDNEIENWVPSENIYFEYDKNGNPSEELFKIAIPESEEYYDNQKMEYTYLLDENFDDYFMPLKQYFAPSYNEHIVNIPLSVTEYFFNGEEWIADYKLSYQYANGTTTVVDNINNYFKIYPNPAHDFLNFEIESQVSSSKIEIFSLTGNKLKSIELGNSQRIEVSDLTSGMYIYNLDLDGKKYSGTIIIQ